VTTIPSRPRAQISASVKPVVRQAAGLAARIAPPGEVSRMASALFSKMARKWNSSSRSWDSMRHRSVVSRQVTAKPSPSRVARKSKARCSRRPPYSSS
jgi:hypothetical protein